jgi:Holliday junction resolvase-like predicted endonuclease
MKKTNKQIGNETEKLFAQYMYQQGWWVHILAYNQNGQPFDVVMSKDNITWFLDVKNVESGELFDLERIEPNQHTAFQMLLSKGNGRCGLAVRFSDGNFYLITYDNLTKLRHNLTHINRNSMIRL